MTKNQISNATALLLILFILVVSMLIPAVILSGCSSAPGKPLKQKAAPEVVRFSTKYLDGYFVALDAFYMPQLPDALSEAEYELHRKVEIVRIMKHMEIENVALDSNDYVEGYHTALADMNDFTCPWSAK